MTPPIIRDSEDEDEEEFLVPDDNAVSKPSQQSINSWMVAEADEILAHENPSQGDQSSLSTGDLQRQIADASRGLFDSTTSDQATIKQPSMASSATPATKKARRHSAVVGSGNSAKAVKRTKTGNVTYGSSKNTRVADPGQFDALRDEALPGTLQTNFANHEPAVMFRDTGSTVADNESSQQRMVEQTINQGKQSSKVSEMKPAESEKPDSSFPWPVSSVPPTQTPGVNTTKLSSHDTAMAHGDFATGAEVNTDETVPTNTTAISQSGAGTGTDRVVQQDRAAQQDRAVQQDRAEPVRPCPPQVMAQVTGPLVFEEQPSPKNAEEATTATEKHSHSPTTWPPINSSPQVSIPRVRVKSTAQTSNRPDEAPKGRKRKASAAIVEPLDSDDRAIGLPKEHYQPRLSRRRATGIVEQPQDFSIVPERAAKRRRKTVNTATAPLEPAEDELAHDPTPASQVKTKPKAKQSGASTAKIDEPVKVAIVSTIAEKPQPGREEVRAALKGLNFPLTNTSFDAGMSEKPSPTKDASPLSAKKVSAPAVVSMPPPSSPALSTSPTKRLSNAAAAFAMPPPASSATRSTRRSHTTIFEDHVDFGGSQQRSPSLRQQQATRKSAALKEVKNVSTQATGRKRRSIVQDDEDDEDDEDELVKSVHVPKKRGRPAKAAVAKKAPTAEIVLQDSDAEPDAEEIVEPPKKKGRTPKAPAGKSKSAEKVLDDSEDDFSEHDIEIDEPPKKKAGRRPSKSKAGNLATEVRTATAAAERSAASNLPATPTSEKQTPPLTKPDAAQKPAVQAKSAPTTHSPIKPSSKVIHRVGLNRRQRVQPLLKMVRPPAPPRQR